MRLDLAEIVRCLGCARDVKVADGSVTVTSVVTDSREAVPGSLFVCIAGERVDGHDYAARAVEQGAVAVLAARPLEGLSVPVLLVQDTVRALGAVAALWRGKSSARVVGITGSAGKTTVKELLAHVLSRRGKTACNALNLNNQVGMPLCMLKTDGDEDFWVFEAGISHEGDMDELGAILQPDLALILNVGAAHTEGLGERGVAWHKSRLLAHLAPEGQALVSADYDDLVREARAVFGDVLFFTASGRPLSYRAAYAGCSDGVHGQYRLWLDGRPCDVIAPFRGDYGTENCIAVAAAAHMLGLTAEEIAAGFADAQLPPQRFARSRRGNWDIVDDTYNANPLSMARMLDAAAESAQKRPFVVVLGEMRELGSVADRAGIWPSCVLCWSSGAAAMPMPCGTGWNTACTRASSCPWIPARPSCRPCANICPPIRESRGASCSSRDRAATIWKNCLKLWSRATGCPAAVRRVCRSCITCWYRGRPNGRRSMFSGTSPSVPWPRSSRPWCSPSCWAPGSSPGCAASNAASISCMK